MILGSLESQQQALQLYVEKNHSPTKEDKNQMMKGLTSLQRQTGKTSKHQKRKKCSI
jgi:hypothetical protein